MLGCNNRLCFSWLWSFVYMYSMWKTIIRMSDLSIVYRTSCSCFQKLKSDISSVVNDNHTVRRTCYSFYLYVSFSRFLCVDFIKIRLSLRYVTRAKKTLGTKENKTNDSNHDFYYRYFVFLFSLSHFGGRKMLEAGFFPAQILWFVILSDWEIVQIFVRQWNFRLSEVGYGLSVWTTTTTKTEVSFTISIFQRWRWNWTRNYRSVCQC